jgi:glutathione S-transferase
MKEAAHLALHNLAGYLARGEARPAYQRAFEAQLAVNASKKS